MSVKRAFRFRFYPTAQHEQQLAQHFSCVRFVYNHMLARRQQRYKDGLKSNYGDGVAALIALKQTPECVWLRDVSIIALQASLRHLDTAYRNFFARRADLPRFKLKRGAQSYSLMRNGFTLCDGKPTLAKMAAPLDVRWSHQLPATPSSLTVSGDAAGRYFVSLLCDDAVAPLPATNRIVAANLGLTHFLTFADARPPLSARSSPAGCCIGYGALAARFRANTRVQKTVTRRASVSRGCTRALPTRARISCTNCRPSLSAKTRLCSWRTCASGA
ncbi:transposase, IS605 OrfB family protein [Paraburkholderia hospita]|uniref:Transposase, IS605 OrfB family protein n=1 Tax=Paraburkholderia hospita TaxID=169430 RepID=A0ABN0FD32_9BURK|nr:transposase, IS605 OrfB family protein [Paraburkholderia hospita]